MTVYRGALYTAPSLRRAAFSWLIFLGPLFVSTYWLANQVTAARSNVDAVVFDWEYAIPFIPWTIVPYWSIDLLYVLSLFICRTRPELDTHGRRLAVAQLIAVTCFLLFPLRFTFARPETDGIFGSLFDALAAFDLPYNQAPSLHIALLVILWVHYLHQVAPRWHMLVHAWTALIGISVLTTYQHHFIDIPTGLWLGCFCVWVIPGDASCTTHTLALTSDPKRRGLAASYAIGAMAIGITALRLGGVWLWLLWFAGALALVSLIYAFMDASAFGKVGGAHVDCTSRWLFWPYFLAVRGNALWHTRNSRVPARLSERIWFGPLPSRKERATFLGATILDLTAEMSYEPLGNRYIQIPLLDLIAPSEHQLEVAVRAIDEAKNRGPVLVCCALGLSRSACVAAAWLIGHERMSAEDAAQQVRKLRPGVVLNRDHLTVLGRFARRHGAG